MSKFTDFFMGFKRRYDAQVIRNKNMDDFLATAKDNFDKIGKMNTAIDNIETKVGTLESKVDNLQTDMTAMSEHLEVIGKGTKLELLETLHRWKKLLTERGWKTKEEMKEIKELYELYNKKLHGNGQGTDYYNEISALPEREIPNS